MNIRTAPWRLSAGILACLALLSGGAIDARAQGQGGLVPERRAVLMQNVDLFGNDIRSVFDTTLAQCETICLADPDCQAFTFNRRNGSCFPKRAVGEMSAFEGALSASIIGTDPAVLAAAAARSADLAFLPDGLRRAAREAATGFGRRYPVDQWTEADFLRAAEGARRAGNGDNVLWFLRAAATLSDRAETWAELAAFGLERADQPGVNRRATYSDAAAAAANAYLRAASPEIAAQALIHLASALEGLGMGRLAVPALRLARATAPSPEIDAALERAVSLYGFRVTAHNVETDSASPRICMDFSERLADDGVDYTDYVELTGGRPLAEADGWRLCVEGIVHGERHVLRLRPGLPSAEGDVLSSQVEIAFYVRDRSPMARFPGRGNVLPASGPAALPVVTVNTTALELTLYTVDDRNLLRGLQDRTIGARLWSFEERQLAEELGARIWTGRAEVAMELNREVTTLLPLDGINVPLPPGLYGLAARIPGVNPFDGPAATQWFVVSDIGLITASGSDGMHVFIRSLESATPLAGAELRLVATNNAILGEAVSDAEGRARFDPGLLRGTGGLAPALLTAVIPDASSEGAALDYAFLDLRGPEFDLSDRGVVGREVPRGLDVFASTERGAYRPGERVHATILARDGRADAVEGLPLTAIVTRPDGAEHARFVLPDAGAGGRVATLDLPGAAQRGTWRMALHADPEAPALQSLAFLVEDFLPERIDASLALPEGSIDPASLPELELEARYLWGAPGGDLAVEGDLRLMPARGLETWPGYRFGRHDHAPGLATARLDPVRTDAAGRAVLPLTLPEAESADRPMEARITVQVREGSGRPIERSLTRAVLPSGPLLGIRPLFEGDMLEEGANAAFSLVALGADGAPVPARLTWVLNRVETRYQWYEAWGSWNWEPVTRRIRVAAGEVMLDGTGPAVLEQPVEWGRFELRVEIADGPFAASSIPFSAGWFAPADATATPDMLEVGLDRATYAVGEQALLRIVPRQPGEAIVKVMSDRLVESRTVGLQAGENTLLLDVTEDWGAGVYVAATALSPVARRGNRAPVRALGLAHAAVDPGDRALDLRIDAPGRADPRAPLPVRLSVAGIAPGETVHATLAAVDLGILNLTGFRAPDPSAHYFGQKRLGMGLRDLYGRLIEPEGSATARIRSGGDASAGMRMQAPPPTEELVAFFSGPITLGPDGAAEISFDLPAFNGTVRLMAVAWSARGVGQAQSDVQVADPVVVTASLPRFLAPGDESRLLLEFAHASGPAGEMALSILPEGPVVLAGAVPARLDLADGGRANLSLPIAAGIGEGTARLVVRLTTPDGRLLDKPLMLDLRDNGPEIARSDRLTLAPGANLRLGEAVFDGLSLSGARATLALGALSRLDAPGLLAALDTYPFACTEQIASQLLALIHFETLATALEMEGAADNGRRIAGAIEAILLNQSSAGGFGLWFPDSGDFWLDAYVTDVLSRARAWGHPVPARAMAAALDNLQSWLSYAPDFEEGGQDVAYALYVLAREGAARMGDLRYYADARAEAFATPLARAQLGAALALYGDQPRADRMFRLAETMASRPQARDGAGLWRADYGTSTRDAAGLLALAAEAGSTAIDLPALTERVGAALRPGRTASTQEMAWSLLAAHALGSEPLPGGLVLDGAPMGGAGMQVIRPGPDMARLLQNDGARPVEVTLTSFGRPLVPEPAGGDGYRIERAYFTLEGGAADPSRVAAGTRLVTVLTVTPLRGGEGRLMVSDPLPAGFEIDNPALLRSGDVRALDWLDLEASPTHAEFRDDRFLAAVDWRRDAPFRLAYVVRAITPGSYLHPAATVEDMYRPQRRGWTATGRVRVTE